MSFELEMAPSAPSQTKRVGNSQFRVIVVGAGVAGLSASHCLQRAGIDHVVIEKHKEVAPHWGASITFYPQGARILSQLGCLESVMATSAPCKWFWSRKPDGTAISRNGFFGFVKENHDQDIIVLERRQFLQSMYDCLPSKEPIRTGCHIVKVDQHPSGVTVTLNDGSVEEADMILGCDGVHSPTRSIMWDHANRKEPGYITATEKNSLKATWKCLVGMGPGTPELGTSDMTVGHESKFSFLSITQPNATFWFVFFKIEKPYGWPRRRRYTDQEADAAAASVSDHPLSESLMFGELWRRRYRSTMLDIEEGVLDHWFYDRIVLAGDCIHKVTPNIGLGGNMALESVVVLCNHLEKMLAAQGGAKPSRATLSKTFAAYQKERYPRVKEVMDFSSLITKVQAWDTPLHKLYANWISPYQPERIIANQIGEIVRRGPKISYGADLGDKFGKAGLLDYTDNEQESEKKTDSFIGKRESLQWLVSGFTLLMVAMGVVQWGRVLPLLSNS